MLRQTMQASMTNMKRLTAKPCNALAFWEHFGRMVQFRYLGRTVKLDELQVVISQALLVDFTPALPCN